MKYIERLSSYFKKESRNFDAVTFNRLRHQKPYSPINSDIRNQGNLLQQSSRELEKNNPFVAKFLHAMTVNVVGEKGFSLYVNGRDYVEFIDENGNHAYKEVLDEYKNKSIFKAFEKWSRKENCDYRGVLNFKQMQDLMIRSLCRDGEFLILKITDKDSLFGFKLLIIDNDKFTRDLNLDIENGQIINNVEYDSNGKIRAYYIKDLPSVTSLRLPADVGIEKVSGYVRLDSSRCIHVFKTLTADQTRGVSLLLPAIDSLNNIYEYQKAELINAKSNAGIMGFFKKSESATVESPVDYRMREFDDESDEGEEEYFITDNTPGTYHPLPVGWDYVDNNSKYPDSFDKFIEANIRIASTALGMSFEELANNRERVSFSSIRSGIMSDRDNYKFYQNFLIENVMNNIYEEWLFNALVNKAISCPCGKVIQEIEYLKFTESTWRGRGFSYVNPKQDIEASILAIKNGLSSRQREVEKNGSDIDEIFDELEREKGLSESKGLDFNNVIIKEKIVEKDDEVD